MVYEDIFPLEYTEVTPGLGCVLSWCQKEGIGERQGANECPVLWGQGASEEHFWRYGLPISMGEGVFLPAGGRKHGLGTSKGAGRGLCIVVTAARHLSWIDDNLQEIGDKLLICSNNSRGLSIAQEKCSLLHALLHPQGLRSPWGHSQPWPPATPASTEWTLNQGESSGTALRCPRLPTSTLVLDGWG